MAKRKFSFMLRLLDRNPDRVEMSRLGEYIREFAMLLGEDNKPTFAGIKKASIGVMAAVPVERTHYSRARITQARLDEGSKPGKHLHHIEEMMGKDAIGVAQILDQDDNIIHVIFGIKPEATSATERLFQESIVDAVVTGLVGVDDTMHLHARDGFDRDLKLLVRDEKLAREILLRFRIGTVRMVVRGTWLRTENGWSPEASKCTVQSFQVLDDTPFGEVLERIARIPGNGWTELKDPLSTWDNIRGIH